MGCCGARCPKALVRAGTFAGRYWRRVMAVVAPVALSPLLIVYDSKVSLYSKESSLCSSWIIYILTTSNFYMQCLFFFVSLRFHDARSASLIQIRVITQFTKGVLCVQLTEYSNVSVERVTRVGSLSVRKQSRSDNWMLIAANLATSRYLAGVVPLSAGMTRALTLSVWTAAATTSHYRLKYAGSQEPSYANDGFSVENGHGSVESLELQNKESEQRWEASHSRFRHAMLLGIAYAANIGGTGSVIGTAPNLIVMGLVEELYPNSATLSFATWMIYNVPPMILCVICAWLYLYFQFIPKRFRSGQLNQEAVRRAIKKRYDDLGPMSFHEAAVLTVFIATVLLWFFRDPYVVTGWASLFPLGKLIKDATPAMLMVTLLFLIPAKPIADPGGPGLLSWSVVQKKIPWGVLLLMGGSFSMAEASKNSGLSVMIGRFLTHLDFLHPILLVTVLCVFTCVVTEIASNTATASVLLPITSYLVRL
ncbi:unnamed protein product [Ixodes hexagonus]